MVLVGVFLKTYLLSALVSCLFSKIEYGKHRTSTVEDRTSEGDVAPKNHNVDNRFFVLRLIIKRAIILWYPTHLLIFKRFDLKNLFINKKINSIKNTTPSIDYNFWSVICFNSTFVITSLTHVNFFAICMFSSSLFYIL